MPTAMGNAMALEWRLPLMVFLTGAAAIRIDVERNFAMWAGLIALVPIGRTADVAVHWMRAQDDVTALVEALDTIPARSSVLPLQNIPTEAEMHRAPLGRYHSGELPSFNQSSSLAVPLRHDFVPNLFSRRGMQPLVVEKPWVEHSVSEGEMAQARALTDPELGPNLAAGIREGLACVSIMPCC